MTIRFQGGGGGGGSGVTSFNDRTGSVVPASDDYTAEEIGPSGVFDIAENLAEGVPSTMRTNLGLGSAATANKVAAGSVGVLDATDPTTTNSRAPTGAAGGDLTGTFPSPTLTAISTAGTTGDAAHSLVITIDAKGRVTGVVANAIAIAEAAVTGLVADLAAKAPLASPALTGTPTAPTQTVGDTSNALATDSFVATAVNNAISGVNNAIAVQAATTAAGDTSGLTYNNGVSGVGATLTGTVNTAVTIDGFTFTAVGQRLLVKNDTQAPAGAFNGVYYLTQLQDATHAPIFTRALDYNKPSDINNTGAIPVVNGTNGTTTWVLTSSVTTMGTDPLTYTEFSFNPANLLKTTNNLSDVASAATSRTNLGLGTAATQNKVAAGSAGVLDATDPTTTNARTPTAHASTHESGGSDVIRLDQLAAPTSAVALNAQKITGLANGSASTDAVAFGQVVTNDGGAVVGAGTSQGATGCLLITPGNDLRNAIQIQSPDITWRTGLVISALTNVSTTCTATIANPPGTGSLAVGQQINVSGVTGFTTNNPNGTWTIASIVDGTHFTFVVTNAPTGSYTANSGSCLFYGMGQALILYKEGSGTTQAQTLLRIDGVGSIGLGGQIHLDTGLNNGTLFNAAGGFNLWIDLSSAPTGANRTGIVLSNAPAGYTGYFLTATSNTVSNTFFGIKAASDTQMQLLCVNAGTTVFSVNMGAAPGVQCAIQPLGTATIPLYLNVPSGATANILECLNNAALVLSVLPSGQLQTAAANEATGAGNAAFGTGNCPAVTANAVNTWLKATKSDGSQLYVPAWK